MELKAGYKQTEVGVIPEDWEVTSLSSISKEPMLNGLFYKPSLKGCGVKLINVGDLYIHTPIDFDALELFDATGKECERFKVEDGDLFFTRSSVVPSGIAQCNIYREREPEPVVFDSHVIRFRPDIKRVNPSYLFRFCVASIARRYLVAHAKTATMTTIDQHILRKCPVILPPIIEQEAIAEALSDADALIESLEKLIAKKRQIKQGAMQESLTGKRRLSGFHEEWENKHLGNLGKFLKGSGVSKNESQSGCLPCVRYGEIYTKHNDYIRTFYSWITEDVAVTATRLRCGDILFAGSGETKEEIGKCAAFVDDVEAYAGGDIVILRPEKMDSLFLGYYLNTAPIIHQKASRGQGDAIVHIGAAALSTIRGSFPSINEQTAIATILSDMDTEITALEAKLAKARQIKQGMMQELLTGRIRLI